MFSRGAIEYVAKAIVTIEAEGGRGDASSERGMLAVWAQELRDRGYEIEVIWESRALGIATHVVGTKGDGRIRASHIPDPPVWVEVRGDGEKTLWIVTPTEGRKVNTVVLVRQMHPEWSLKEARECMEGKRPLLEKVDEATWACAARYLSRVSVAIRSDDGT